MKKIILGTAMAIACTLSVSAQQRTILYEEFTGENCGPCAAANPGLEALMASNVGKIIHVTYMEPVPTTGYFYRTDTVVFGSRFGCTYSAGGYYSPLWGLWSNCFTPSGFMDGHLSDSTASPAPCGSCGNVAAFTQSDIDNEYTLPSPLKITATHYFNAAHGAVPASDSVYGRVIIQGASTYGASQLKLRVAFVKTMNFTHAPGSNGETHFENVARRNFPDEAGQAIAAHWTTSTIDTYTYSGVITHLDTFTNVTVVDSNFVVWVQNDSTTPAVTNAFRVQQAAMSVYTPLVSHVGVAPLTASSINLNIYPNPAKESATAYFTLDHSANVQVKVIDELGRTVNNIPAQSMNSGNQTINIGTNLLAAGVYTVAVEVDGALFTQKLSITK